MLIADISKMVSDRVYQPFLDSVKDVYDIMTIMTALQMVLPVMCIIKYF